MRQEPVKGLFIVLTNPLPGREDEYNEWYSNTHLREMVAVEGFISARRYELTKDQLSADQRFRYVAIYEVEAGKSQAVLDSLQAGIALMSASSVINFNEGQATLVESINDTVYRT